MKTIILGLVCSCFLVAGCKKNAAEDENPLYGQWKWIMSKGGITGSDIKTPPPDSFRTLYIFNASQYTIDEGKDDFQRMRYTTQPVTNILTGAAAQGITFFNASGQPGIPQFYVIEHTGPADTLLLITDNVADGYVHYYSWIGE